MLLFLVLAPRVRIEQRAFSANGSGRFGPKQRPGMKKPQNDLIKPLLRKGYYP
jgi:hypothetical protein